MAGLKAETMKDWVVSTKIVGGGMTMSQVAESIFPAASIVTAQSWSSLPASWWIISCNAGHAAIASNNRTMPTSKAARAGLPNETRWLFTYCKSFAI